MQEARTTEPDTEGAAEAGRSALGLRQAAPGWLTLFLYGILGVGVLFILISIASGWGHWTLLVGLILAIGGLVIALNPGRGSVAGGTER
jgi:hypothetical protein